MVILSFNLKIKEVEIEWGLQKDMIHSLKIHFQTFQLPVVKESDFNERSLSRIYLSLKFKPPRYCDIDDIGSFHKCVVLI